MSATGLEVFDKTLQAVHSAFAVRSRHRDHWQVQKLRYALPADIRALWPDGEFRPM
jgi:uncharacterized protein (DUF2267 family)